MLYQSTGNSSSSSNNNNNNNNNLFISIKESFMLWRNIDGIM